MLADSATDDVFEEELFFGSQGNTAQLRWIGREFIFFRDIPAHLDPNGCPAILPRPGVASVCTCAIQSESFIKDTLKGFMCLDSDEPIVLPRSLNVQEVISGDGLLVLIHVWASARLQKCTSLAPEARKEDGKKSIKALCDAFDHMERVVYPKIVSLTSYHEREAGILMSLVTFLASLGNCASAIWEDRTFFEKSKQTFLYRRVVEIFHVKFEDIWGKEQSRVAAELDGGFPYLAYVITHLPQPTCQAPRMAVDRKVYRTKHATPWCSCVRIMKPSMGDLRRILSRREKSKDFPVVYYKKDAGKLPRLLVREASKGPYLAISHVWADGAGGCPEDGMPHCQVQRLAQRAKELLRNEEGAFWMDTLCVPEDKDLRDAAIDLMADTYRNAEKVLVIDEGIRAMCTMESEKEQCLLRIATSGWRQRIWTLQEALLARDLRFEFADGIVGCDFFNEQSHFMALKVFPILQYLPHDDTKRVFSARTKTDEVVALRFSQIIHLLQHRTTSHPADEPIAICSLLKIDPRLLMQHDDFEERMKTFLTRLQDIPVQLSMVGWRTHRLSLRNFTWAPKTLSASFLSDECLDDSSTACVDAERGLMQDLHVINLHNEVSLRATDGIVVVVATSPDDSTSNPAPRNIEERRCDLCRGALGTKYTLHVLPSEHPFSDLKVDSIEINAIVMQESWSSRVRHVDTNVALVKIDEESWNKPSGQGRKRSQLSCKFVSVGNASSGYPDPVETARSKQSWKHVKGTEAERYVVIE